LPFSRELKFVLRGGLGFFDNAVEKNDLLLHDDEKYARDLIR
jgi:hypothetical protein